MKDFAEANGINLTFEDNKRETDKKRRMDAEEEQFVMTKVGFTIHFMFHFNFYRNSSIKCKKSTTGGSWRI